MTSILTKVTVLAVSDEVANKALEELGIHIDLLQCEPSPLGGKRWLCSIKGCSKHFPKLSSLKVFCIMTCSEILVITICLMLNLEVLSDLIFSFHNNSSSFHNSIYNVFSSVAWFALESKCCSSVICFVVCNSCSVAHCLSLLIMLSRIHFFYICRTAFCHCCPQVHLLSHNGIRPYKCNYENCDWAFYTWYKLKRHIETHLKRRDFVVSDGVNLRFTHAFRG